MSKRIGLRIAAGLALVAVLVAAGYVGVLEWSRARVRAEVDTVFAGLRETGARATFTDATYDPREQAVSVTGISVVSKDATATVKIDRLLARGGERPHDRRVALDALDLSGLEITLTGDAAAGGSITYTLPQVMIDRYTGPLTLIAAGEGNGPFGALRVALRQMAATTAAKVTIPEARGRIAPAGGPPMEVTYTNVAAEGVNAGTIRSLIVDRAAFAFTPPAPDGAGTAAPGRITGQVQGIVAVQIDTAPLLAMTAPDGAPARVADAYARIYAKVVTGPYSMTQENGPSMSAAAVLVENAGLKPSAFDARRIVALNALSLKGASLTLEESRRALELSRDLIDGIAFGTVAVSDLRTQQEGESGRVASLRLEGLAAGILDSLVLEGLEATPKAGAPGAPPAAPSGKVARFAIRQLDLNQFSRLAAEAQAPSPMAALVLFKVMSGLELTGVDVPYGDGPDSPPVRIGRLALSWGGAQGALPTSLDFALSDVSGPIRAEDGEPFTYLLNAGMTRATISLALKAAYDADTQTLTFAPVTSEVKEAFRVSLEGSIVEVPPAAFSDATGFISAWPKVAAGPVKVTLTDLGLAKLVYAQLAAADGISVDDYRARLVETTEAIAADLGAASPDAAAVGTAVVAFLRNPGTLTVTATPKGRVPLMALAASDDPGALLETFTFTATAAP